MAEESIHYIPSSPPAHEQWDGLRSGVWESSQPGHPNPLFIHKDSWKLRGSFLWHFREIRVSANRVPVLPPGEFPLGQKHRPMRKFPGNEWDYNFIAQLPARNLFNLHNSPDCFSHYYWKVIAEPHFLYLWANFWSPAGIYEQTIWNHSFLC